MGSEFRPTKIDEATDLIIDHRGITPKKLGGDFLGFGTQVISAKNVYGGRLHLQDNPRFVPPKMADRWMPDKLRRGDVLLTSEAPLGQAAYLDDDHDYCLGQRLFALRARPGVAVGRFLYYALISPQVQMRLHARATGTTAQGIKQSELRQVEIDLPEFEEQARIAATLAALDDKIDSNRRLAEAQDAFCLARFEQVDGEGGAASAALDEYVDLTPGRTYATADLDDPNETTGLLTLKAVESGGGFSTSGIRRYSGRFKPAQIATPGDIIVAHTDLTQRATVLGRPALVRSVSGFDTLVASMHVPIIRPRDGRLPASFLYYLLKSQRFHEHAYGRSHGTTVLMLNKRAVCEFKTSLPTQTALHEFDAIARPLVASMSHLAIESEGLTQIRDTLLPRMISGQIQVPDTDDPKEVIGPMAERLGPVRS